MLTNVKKGAILVLVLSLVVSMFASVSFAAERPIGLVVNGQELQPDVPPQMIKNRTMVPVRWVSEALGADIKWDQKNNRVLVNSPDDTPVTPSSDIQLIVDGKTIQPDVPPQLVNNRTMVPVRWVSEALGADVKWDQEAYVVYVNASAAEDLPEGAVRIPNKYDEEFILNDDELLIFIENYKPFEEDGVLDRVIGDKLKEQFPEYNIRLVVWDIPLRTTDLVDAGVTPDIYIATPRTHIDKVLEEYDWHLDMTDMIDASSIDLSVLNQGAVEMIKSRSDGGMYAVPLFIREFIMYYNKDIFDAFDQPYPTNGMTYDEIFELTQKVMGQSGTVTYKGYTQHPDQYLDFNQLGLYPFLPGDSEEPSLTEIRDSVDITTDEWLRLTENMYRFLALPGNGFNSTADFFERGNYAMAVDTVDKIATYRMVDGYYGVEHTEIYEGWAEKIQNLGAVSVPVLSEEDNWIYQPNLMSASITKQSDKKEQAMEIIEWLVSEEGQKEFSSHGMKAVLQTDAVVDAFGSKIEGIMDVDGIKEAVYWGENAQVQNYENTEWPAPGFPLYFVFRMYVLQNGNPPEIALQNAEAEIYKWYAWTE